MAKEGETGKAGEAAIFKKVKKGGEHGFHGGVWKLAYADFVTAMMAFFLLMWLLNVTSEEMKSGIAQYFSPESVSPSTSGSGDVFFGLTISTESPMQAQTVGSATVVPIPEAIRQGQGGAAAGDATTEAPQSTANAAGNASGTGQKGDASGAPPLPEKEADELRARILEAARQVGLRDITGTNLEVAARPDGLLIQIIDAPGIAMFEIGSSRLQPEALRFLGIIADIVRQRAEPIAIFGHTDARQFASTTYTNWELAADRANAARRVLLASGVAPARVQNVSSRADRMPRNAGDPLAAENRRIEILLQRE
jgi:chemotaxis protein MotB